MPWQDPRSTEEKGLGHVHRRERAAALRALVPGTLCPLCGEPMTPAQDLDFDHVIPRAEGGTDGPKRLVHAGCNRRRGGQLGHQRMRENLARAVLAGEEGPPAAAAASGPSSRPSGVQGYQEAYRRAGSSVRVEGQPGRPGIPRYLPAGAPDVERVPSGTLYRDPEGFYWQRRVLGWSPVSEWWVLPADPVWPDVPG